MRTIRFLIVAIIITAVNVSPVSGFTTGVWSFKKAPNGRFEVARRATRKRSSRSGSRRGRVRSRRNFLSNRKSFSRDGNNVKRNRSRSTRGKRSRRSGSTRSR